MKPPLLEWNHNMKPPYLADVPTLLGWKEDIAQAESSVN